MDIHFDFTFFLTVATLITGCACLIDFVRRKKKDAAHADGENSGAGEEKKQGAVTEFSKSFFPVLALVLVIRSFVAEPFRIPSGSMIPTLLVGDFIVVTKYNYGLKLPVLDKTFIPVSTPQRGDVIVFRYPKDTSIDFIKRVIAIPGDTIVYRNNQLFINGEEMVSKRLDDFNYTDIYGQLNFATEKTENILGYEHRMLNHNNARTIDGQSINIPEGHYFVMGDNRDRSKDSRVWGLVSEKHLVGKAQFIWMHWGLENISRIGTKIQ